MTAGDKFACTAFVLTLFLFNTAAGFALMADRITAGAEHYWAAEVIVGIEAWCLLGPLPVILGAIWNEKRPRA